MASRPGEAVPRETFLDEVWEYNAWSTTRTVDNFIASLRSQLKPEPESPCYILTARGTGYRLAVPD